MISKLIWLLSTLAWVYPLQCCSDIPGKHIGMNFEPQDSSELGNDVPSNMTSFEPTLVNESLPRDTLQNRMARRRWPITRVHFNHPIQSPVDLITYRAVTMNLPLLNIVEPKLQGVKATLYNSGHTVYVYIKQPPNRRPALTGGPLRRKFIFEQMHFHWGTEDIWGSEHFVDGESFAVEIHLVHYNSRYPTFEIAATMPDGLAVLTVFAEENYQTNTLLEPLDRMLGDVSEAMSSVTLDSKEAMQWPASSFSINKEYYTYPGSLSTEPYTENVIFIILPKPIHLSHTQLKAFRELHSSCMPELVSSRILDNKRQLQPLHHRPIVRSTHLMR